MKLHWVSIFGLVFLSTLSVALASSCYEKTNYSTSNKDTKSEDINDIILSTESSTKVIFPDQKGKNLQFKNRLYELEIEVLELSEKSSFLINICITRNCDNPTSDIISSFSFFPAPKIGESKKFLVELDDRTYLNNSKTFYFFIIKTIKNSPDAIRLRINSIDELVKNSTD